MPLLKPISGHGSCKGVRDYLVKDGRALAVDLLNLSWDEELMQGFDPKAKEGIDWAAEMDLTRALAGNDAPYRGRPARTFKHYILSPDPKDHATLDQVRRLAQTWARENFPDHEVAIVYHDDSSERLANGEEGILHAHIVVNNTDLATGRRLQDPDPRRLKRSAQRLARDLGLSYFVDQRDGEGERTGKSPARASPMRQVHERKAERELLSRGGYSWVADIRNRVIVAKGLAKDEDDFRDVLGSLGVGVSDASPRGGRPDWIYSLASNPNRKVRGEGLGLVFGRQAVEGHFRNAAPPPIANARQLAESAVELRDHEELRSLAKAMGVVSRYRIRSQPDFDRRIDAAKARSDNKAVLQLVNARDFCERKDLLPRTAAPSASKPLPRGPKKEKQDLGRQQRQDRKRNRAMQQNQERTRNEKERPR